jgi:hypothetical protein
VPTVRAAVAAPNTSAEVTAASGVAAAPCRVPIYAAAYFLSAARTVCSTTQLLPDNTNTSHFPTNTPFVVVVRDLDAATAAAVRAANGRVLAIQPNAGQFPSCRSSWGWIPPPQQHDFQQPYWMQGKASNCVRCSPLSSIHASVATNLTECKGKRPTACST